VLDNNLYVDGEIGIGIGGNACGMLRWVDCRITNNVMLDLGLSRPTGRELGWGMDIFDWDGGLVANNLIVHQRHADVTSTYGINVSSQHQYTRQRGNPYERGIYTRGLTVENNILHGLISAGPVFRVGMAELLENVTIRNNQIQMAGLETPLMDLYGETTTGVTYQGNSYYSDAAPDRWFRVNGKDMGLQEWVEATGEKGARVARASYPDETRSIQSYMKHLGLEPTREAFYAQIRKQCKRNWRKEFTAPVINDWMRAGFDLSRSD
jgi:hypothetical protein